MSESDAGRLEQSFLSPAAIASRQPEDIATRLFSEVGNSGAAAPPAGPGSRSFMMNTFARDPIDTYSPAFAEGERIGEALSRGDWLTAAQELSQYVQQLQKNTPDPEAFAKKEANVFAGMQVADPCDVHLSRLGDKIAIDIDFSAKLRKKCED